MCLYLIAFSFRMVYDMGIPAAHALVEFSASRNRGDKILTLKEKNSKIFMRKFHFSIYMTIT